MPKQSRQLWIRAGDNDDYGTEDSPYAAGERIAEYTQGKRVPSVKWRPMGVEVTPGFTGHNYISLFWGDSDAQPVGKASLTKAEQKSFERGLRTNR